MTRHDDRICLYVNHAASSDEHTRVRRWDPFIAVPAMGEWSELESTLATQATSHAETMGRHIHTSILCCAIRGFLTIYIYLYNIDAMAMAAVAAWDARKSDDGWLSMCTSNENARSIVCIQPACFHRNLSPAFHPFHSDECGHCKVWLTGKRYPSRSLMETLRNSQEKSLLNPYQAYHWHGQYQFSKFWKRCQRHFIKRVKV